MFAVVNFYPKRDNLHKILFLCTLVCKSGFKWVVKIISIIMQWDCRHRYYENWMMGQRTHFPIHLRKTVFGSMQFLQYANHPSVIGVVRAWIANLIYAERLQSGTWLGDVACERKKEWENRAQAWEKSGERRKQKQWSIDSTVFLNWKAFGKWSVAAAKIIREMSAVFFQSHRTPFTERSIYPRSHFLLHFEHIIFVHCVCIIRHGFDILAFYAISWCNSMCVRLCLCVCVFVHLRLIVIRFATELRQKRDAKAEWKILIIAWGVVYIREWWYLTQACILVIPTLDARSV